MNQPIKNRKILSVLLVLLAVFQITACGNSEQDELQTWMQSERNSIKPDVKPIPEPSKFQPFGYGGGRYVEPFSSEKLASILKNDQAQTGGSSALVDQERSRRKQPLEAFPLDSMVMVGSLMRGGQPVALIKVNALLYQVSPGNYLGQNYGRVLKVAENQVMLREIVQDVTGEWIERTASLQLQEEATK
jgi:type IV pilus assembly protein PilP